MSKTSRKTRVRLGAVLAAATAVGLLAWLLLDGDSPSTSTGEAEIVTVDSLRETAATQGAPIYWAGPQDGAELELSQPEAGRTYVRYLTDGAGAGDPRPFLTVGSYAFPSPVSALRRQGKQSDGVLATAPGGGTVYFNRDQPRSVYLAYPGVDIQIEVYDPDFQRALQLVNSGQIVPAS